MSARPAAARVIVALVLMAGLVACSGAGRRLALDLDVDLHSGQAWRATGAAVDDGVICAGGGRQTVQYLDADGGTPLPVAEVVRRQEEGMAAGQPARLIAVIEMTCGDGSGTFTVAEHPFDDTWAITGGNGAYSDLVGEGTIAAQFFDAASVDEPSPDDPPDGAPLMLHYTGTVSIEASEE